MPSVAGSSCLIEQRVGRAVAGEDLVRGERLDGRRRNLLRLELGTRLGEVRPCISASVCARQLASSSAWWRAIVRLVRRGRDQEVAGDDVGALVDELVEGVLAVGAGLAPDDRPGRARRPWRPSRSHACRSTPCRAAADRPGAAPAAGRRAAPHASGSPARCGTRCRSAPGSPACSASSGAVAEVVVHGVRRRRGTQRSWLGPIAIITGRPMADQIE